MHVDFLDIFKGKKRNEVLCSPIVIAFPLNIARTEDNILLVLGEYEQTFPVVS